MLAYAQAQPLTPFRHTPPHAQVEVYRVGTPQQLQQAYAALFGLTYSPGMFVRASTPFYRPGDPAHAAPDFAVSLAHRSEELLAIRLPAGAVLDAEVPPGRG